MTRQILEKMSFDAWMNQSSMNMLKKIQKETFEENTTPILNLPNLLSRVKIKWNNEIDHNMFSRLNDRSKITYRSELIVLLKRLISFVQSLNVDTDDKNSYYMVYKGVYFVLYYNNKTKFMNIITVMCSQTVDCDNYFIDNTEYLD